MLNCWPKTLQLILFSFLIIASSACVMERGTITVNIKKYAPLKITVTNVQIANHQLIINGADLNKVTQVKIGEEIFDIESKTNTTVIANTLSDASFIADKMLNLILSNAQGAAVFTINFSLCDSTLNGAGFDCSINAQDFDVLSYDQGTGKWKPKSINGLSFKGAYDASTTAPTSGGASSAGEYYIISVAGNGYTVGDWAVDNGTTMDKIDNSPSAVSTVHGRIGAVVGAEGDYNLDKLSDVTLGSPTTGNVLKYNGTAWVAGTITSVETDPTVSAFAKSTLPTCSSGEVLKSNGTTLSCVTDNSGAGAFSGAANRVVVTNGSGALAVSAITDTILSYLSNVTSDIQTQLNSKASSSSIVDWSVHSGTGPYIYPTRIYGGAIQASKTLVTDVSGNIVTSNVTPAELNYLSGVTSSIQTQINSISAGASWTVASGDAYRSSGKVGIGTSTPAATLEVVGDVKIGDSNATCSNATQGSIRYNNSSSVLEFCNGSSWNLVQAAACSDATPNAISFANEANATASTLYTSDIILVNGINCNIPVTISGTGSPQFRICSDSGCSTVVQSWTTSPSSISSGQYLQARLTADSVGGSNFQATIIVGGGATVWTVTTAGGDCTASPTPGTVCADGTIYAGLSPDGNIKMFTTRCDAGQTWDGSNCTGSRSALSWNDGTANYPVTSVTSQTTGKTNSSTLNAITSDGAAPYVSAQYCESLNINGHSDWYLPALNELNIMYSNRSAIKNFESTVVYYWASSESNWSEASQIRFVDGNQRNVSKSQGHGVRCVRR